MNGEWISVKDELPQDERYVLVCYKHRPLHITWYSITANQWMHNFAEITHWMDLPEKPAVKREDR